MSQPNAERAAVAVGALVELVLTSFVSKDIAAKTGTWSLISEARCEKGIGIRDSMFGNVYMPGDPPPNYWRVLLPAPASLPGEHGTPERAAAVLDALAGLPGATRLTGGHVVKIQLETCRVFIDKKPNCICNSDSGPGVAKDPDLTEQEHYDARGRDWQKEGALRAWLTAALGETQEARDGRTS